MRIVTWNMGCSPRGSRYRRTHEEAWRYLLDELRPDVALVQEALLNTPTWVRDGRSLVGHPTVAGHDAGSMVITAAPMTEMTVHAYGCCVAAGRVDRGEDAFAAVSVHVSTGKDTNTGQQQRDYLQAFVEAVAPFTTSACVIGGDFNASTEYDERYYGPFFKGMADSGFHDCHRAVHGRDVSSFWGHQAPKGGIQDDHLFVNTASAARVTSCEVIDNETVRRLSDHGPVALELRGGRN